ncbi:microsomal triacylglycerol transfer protein [Aethina tumida]|uniref:microsomal triacylglycerol transfer protein n=1 Tax=Aethina tumida TaxID=116153 RepID=UPI00096B2224|nr:microsomal triacylglycerol transfer protein [Aethina tumida]XP_019876167.1 microsomal triacylglycerol transfer protein [Aethina tumida]
MLPKTNSCSILYILFAWFLGMCYGFVLLSSAAGHNVELNLFEAGEALSYKLHSTVLLNEKDDNSKNVGFFVDGDVVVTTLWSNGNSRILQIEIKEPKLNIKSRKAPAPDGFVPHASKLEKLSNKPYLVVWNKGKIDKVLIPKDEATSIVNLKKGVASLFQFQILDGEIRETDASGECTAKYSSTSQDKFVKTKQDCISPDYSYIYNPEPILGTIIKSTRHTEYYLDLTNNIIKSITSKESHQMFVSAKEDLGNFVETEQVLTLSGQDKSQYFTGDDLETVLSQIVTSSGIFYTQESLLTDKEEDNKEDIQSFPILVNELRNSLKNEALGGLKSARSFIKLINSGRRASKAEITKALDAKENKNILLQLYDVLGFVQTIDSHAAVNKKLKFDNEQSIDQNERYLWALSICSQPNPDVMIDLLNKYNKNMNILAKVKETIILTLASMSSRLRKLKGQDTVKSKVLRDVEETILNNLDYAKGEERYQFFRALNNLKSERTLPTLVNYIKYGSPKEGYLSWKAIRALDKSFWNKSVLKAAEKTFFQLDKKHDTSSRTISADIILLSNPSDEIIKKLLEYLYSKDPAFEIKQYVLQTLKMLADESPEFKEKLMKIIRSDNKLNNYSTLSPRGMSTALTRSFMKTPSSNGSLVSLQELKNGIVKRGTVNIMMDKDGFSQEIFSLGIFSGGLSSFMSSNGDNEVEDDESANAGMELTVLGTQLRPFVFFSGQGELMGHVWSGTASEKTPAYQANALLQDHLEYLRLGSGFIAELNVKGALSFDLSGSVKISIFYSTAESLVEKSAGILLVGSTKVDTAFVKSQVEFTASIEPKLNLQTDIDFSSKMNLCMRLTQPETVFRHNIFKIERIPGSKHKLRIAKYKKYNVSGVTYSLNRKNNEMCSTIFK